MPDSLPAQQAIEMASAVGDTSPPTGTVLMDGVPVNALYGTVDQYVEQ
ncbi:hypothetical protein VV869_14630 [Photobacterium sp. MCCC 1A19761]